MTSRREFLSSTGLAMASPQQPRSIVDCQSHLYVPELIALMEKRKASPYVYRKGKDTYVVVGEWHRRLQPRHADAAAKVADMDAAGITLTALSINDPGPELFGKEGPAVARLVNDYIADVARRYPGRFIGLAVLPLQDIDEAMNEFERCVNRLNMKGVLLYSNLDGSFPDEPRYRPLFREAERREIPLLLHPAYPGPTRLRRPTK